MIHGTVKRQDGMTRVKGYETLPVEVLPDHILLFLGGNAQGKACQDKEKQFI
jgi:hypothetical protein